MSGGFFRGTSADQDTRFSNKQAKLLKTQKFAPELDHLVDTSKVNMDVMKPWIARRVTELLGFEDEVLINFVYGLLDVKEVDGKQIQIQLTGFMEKNTGKFMRELWGLLLSAQKNASGVPQQFLDEKEEEMKKKKAESDRITQEIQKKKNREALETEFMKQKKTDGEADFTGHVDGAANAGPKNSVRRDSSSSLVEEREVDGRHGSRRLSRQHSPSPRSENQSPTLRRNAHAKSSRRSFSKSRSYSEDGPKSRSVSVSASPPRQSISQHKRQLSPTNNSVSPHQLQPLQFNRSPLRKRSPYLGNSSSRFRRRSRSPVRRRSRSPVRHQSPSPVRRRPPSPVRRRSLTPVRHRSPSPIRRRSPSPIRRRSLSPIQRRSPSPVRRRSPSPVRRRSPSPVRRRSPSPVRRRSPSPIRRRSPSPVHLRSSSVRRRSPNQVRRRSPSSPSRRSPSPLRRYRSPVIRRRSPSPPRRYSPPRSRFQSPPRRHRRSPSPSWHRSPLRHRSPVKLRRRSPSPVQDTSPLLRSRSPVRRRPPSPVRRKSPLRRSPAHRRRSPLHNAADVRSSPQQRNRVQSLHRSRSPQIHESLIVERTNHSDGIESGRNRRSPPSWKRDENEKDDFRHSVVSPSERQNARSGSNIRKSLSLFHERDMDSSGNRAHSLSKSPVRQSRRRKDNLGASKGDDLDPREIQNTHSSRKRSPCSPTRIMVKSSQKSDSRESSPDIVVSKELNSSRGKLKEHHEQRRNMEHTGRQFRQASCLHEDVEYGPGKSDVNFLPDGGNKRSSPFAEERPRNEKNHLHASYSKDTSEIDDMHKFQLEDDSNYAKKSKKQLDNDKYRVGPADTDSEEDGISRSLGNEKRSKKSEINEAASEDEDYDSAKDHRKEVKRRRREERKMRKEEKRKRREERHRKREERRAQKKAKYLDTVTPPSDYGRNDGAANNSDEDAGLRTSKMSDIEEMESDQKQLEIDLRNKALESLRAKKAISH